MKLTRRDLFVGASAAQFLHGASSPRLLAQVYIFTQDASRRKTRATDEVDTVLATVRQAGYRGVELLADFFDSGVRERTQAAARANGLAVPIVYVGGTYHDEAAVQGTHERVLALAEACGATWINTNPLPKPKRERKSDQELKVQAAALDKLGAALGTRGQRLMVHHHDTEMAEDAREWRYVLRNTDAKNVSLCLDTHWIFRAGQDPVKLTAEAGKRVASLHLRNSRNNIWTETLGTGDVDYPAIAKTLDRSGAKPFLVVELAHEKGTEGNWELGKALRDSRTYAEQVFGVKA